MGTAMVYEGGFADPAREGARAFRAVLDALARPGRLSALAVVGTPRPWSPAAGGLILALADAETPLWIDPGAGAAADQLAAWALFHTGAPRTAQVGEAAFAIGGWDALLPLSRWPAGTAEYPDRGTTLIVEVSGFQGAPLGIAGPGIEGVTRIAPALPEGALAALARNAARYPLGLDFFFTAGDRLLGLPRSTRIAGAEGG